MLTAECDIDVSFIFTAPDRRKMRLEVTPCKHLEHRTWQFTADSDILNCSNPYRSVWLPRDDTLDGLVFAAVCAGEPGPLIDALMERVPAGEFYEELVKIVGVRCAT
jgi:hypothetical protein